MSSVDLIRRHWDSGAAGYIYIGMLRPKKSPPTAGFGNMYRSWFPYEVYVLDDVVGTLQI